MGRDSHYWRAMSGTGTKLTQDIFCGIHITIMHTSTPRTNPIPYSKACDTFRPRIGQSAAIRAGLGCIALVHFFKPRAMLNSLVRQLSSEGRPPSIKNRLSHGGLGKSGGVHVANRNVIKLSHDAGAELVEKVMPSGSVLCVNSLFSPFLVRTLGHGQGLFCASVYALSLDFLPSGKRGEFFQAEINANAPHRLTRLNRYSLYFNHDIQEPVSTTVARKVGAILDLSFGQRAAAEDAKSVPGKPESIPLALQVSPLEWNPSSGFLSAIAQVRAFLLATGSGVLVADGVDRPPIQAQLTPAPGGELIQVKPGMPVPAESQRIFLPVIAKVPDEINRPTLPIQQSIQGLDTVTIDQNHAQILIQE